MGALTPAEIDPTQVAAGRLFDFTEATIRNEPLRSAALRAAERAWATGREVCYAMNTVRSRGGGRPRRIIAVQRCACARADIVLMNADEAGLHHRGGRTRSRGEIVAELGPRIVLVTSGEHGCVVCYDGTVTAIAARRVEVVYDIGAGDAFHAGFVAAHLAGMDAAGGRPFRLGCGGPADHAGLPPGPTWDEVMALGQGRVVDRTSACWHSHKQKRRFPGILPRLCGEV